ncbi:MAG: site-specific DNA-methyltransferase [Armatimonadetes bacterium]|nr:site-specific DNA-methyltransferase [Armatimonadota bacterium]
MRSADLLDEIRRADEELTARYRDALAVNRHLDRKWVSFQGNKTVTGSRWFKYKEGFSVALMHYIFDSLGIRQGRILDPFVGSGTALFAAREAGVHATGIELLPSSIESIRVRNRLLSCDPAKVSAGLKDFADRRVWEKPGEIEPFRHIAITHGAFSEETERQLGRYLYESDRLSDPDVRSALRFAALCVLEPISYTRKDGQYLRWDYRSGRKGGAKPFDKGKIYPFTEAISSKLNEMAEDIEGQEAAHRGLGTLFQPSDSGEIEVLSGSCLEILPTLPEDSFDGLVTSPPYCNRYDYTRTYALELALLNIGEEGIRKLRQTMLSCTVENKDKPHLSEWFRAEVYHQAQAAFESQTMLQLVLRYLEECKADKTINNSGIPRMIKNYFREMALLIFECARVLKPGAPFVMVNDNVRYMGAHLPVDLILSDFARQAGFDVRTIWMLPRGKGNSSQQMGEHGREELRKCVYIWHTGRASTAIPAIAQDRQLAPAR